MCGRIGEIAIAHTLAEHCGSGGDGFDVAWNFDALVRFLRERLAGTCASTKLTQHSLYMCFVVQESFFFRRGVYIQLKSKVEAKSVVYS